MIALFYVILHFLLMIICNRIEINKSNPECSCFKLRTKLFLPRTSREPKGSNETANYQQLCKASGTL